ncbi:hypothetical protein BDZ90DRAFT_159104 [Jaminaea rosea]|uniref:Uncharacterized protein n=1 Tax=Jaminaea rosea TaxID=1569628 RepID=A0A316URN5_9BASI|nr:hypothetical protein BDZ90DRAFT_159104 [Jaminaea rosea]PWN27980.1 hypothetical protein BDZ90DRAFT_159104 [Jaminaea rosea]
MSPATTRASASPSPSSLRSAPPSPVQSLLDGAPTPPSQQSLPPPLLCTPERFIGGAQPAQPRSAPATISGARAPADIKRIKMEQQSTPTKTKGRPPQTSASPRSTKATATVGATAGQAVLAETATTTLTTRSASGSAQSSPRRNRPVHKIPSRDVALKTSVCRTDSLPTPALTPSGDRAQIHHRATTSTPGKRPRDGNTISQSSPSSKRLQIDNPAQSASLPAPAATSERRPSATNADAVRHLSTQDASSSSASSSPAPLEMRPKAKEASAATYISPISATATPAPASGAIASAEEAAAAATAAWAEAAPPVASPAQEGSASRDRARTGSSSSAASEAVADGAAQISSAKKPTDADRSSAASSSQAAREHSEANYLVTVRTIDGSVTTTGKRFKALPESFRSALITLNASGQLTAEGTEITTSFFLEETKETVVAILEWYRARVREQARLVPYRTIPC